MKKTYTIVFTSFLVLLYGVHAEQFCEQSFAPIRRDVEKKAIELGYTEPVFYAGLNAIHQLTELGKDLRNRSINPKTTHIEDLEPFIPMHIHHIQEGLITSKQPKKLTDLNKLKKEAQIRMKNKQVTLYWWLLFNIRLSALATPSHKITLEQKFLEKYKTHNELVNYIENKNNHLMNTIQKTLTFISENSNFTYNFQPWNTGIKSNSKKRLESCSC